MPSQNVPHLCGGILFDLLLETRKERAKIRDRANGGTDSLSDTDVYVGLANIVTGENLSSSNGETLNKYVSNYKKCENSKGLYVPFTDEKFKSTFDSGYKKKSPAILKRTAGFIEKYLNNEKCKWLVRVLIEIMQNDDEINQDTEIAISFEKSMPISRLHEAKSIHFLPFFLSVLHYVINNCPDCESGRYTFISWYSQTSPKAQWKFKPDVLRKIGSSINDIEVSTDLDFSEVSPKDFNNNQSSENDSITDKKDSTPRDTESSDESSSENHLSKRDTRLLSKLAKDFNVILKFSSSTDLLVSLMPGVILDTFDELRGEWMYPDTDFKNQNLNSLKYDILKTLNNYFMFWGLYMSPYPGCTDYYHVPKNVYIGKWKTKEELQTRIQSDLNACQDLYKRLYKYVIDFDIEISEDADAEVITASNTPDTSNKTQITIIQNQTNIAHSESKTYNIKDSNVTIND